MKSKPFISVILPVYNGEIHLKECIESILNQTYQNFEFIIVDDASTDATPKILEKFLSQDERVRIFTHKINKKQTVAANTAIKNAKGKYLARMDADDIALPTRLEKQLVFMEENPNIGLTGTWVDIIDEKGEIIKIWHTNSSNGYLGWNLLFGTSFAHSSVMMIKGLVEQVGYYQSPEAEDYDLWSRLSRITEVANLPEVLQQKRVWPGQLALKVPTETRDCVLQIMRININHLLGDSNLDLCTIRNIRKVSDKNPPLNENSIIIDTKKIILQLFNKYVAQSDLTGAEKKLINRNVFQKLWTLASWKSSLNYTKSLHDRLFLAYRFPKLFLYRLIRGNK